MQRHFILNGGHILIESVLDHLVFATQSVEVIVVESQQVTIHSQTHVCLQEHHTLVNLYKTILKSFFHSCILNSFLIHTHKYLLLYSYINTYRMFKSL